MPYSTMHHSEQKIAHVHISALNVALWNIDQLHYGICELGQYSIPSPDTMLTTKFIMTTWHENAFRITGPSTVIGALMFTSMLDLIF